VRLATVIIALAIALAGCGGDDDDGARSPQDRRLEDAAAVYEEIRDLTDKQQIERVGAAWAATYSRKDEAMCDYLHPDIAGGCSELVQGALSGSSRIQRSFAGTSVVRAESKRRRAVAEFSNGERVDFAKDADDRWTIVRTDRAG
jgi:hypothetical protein